MMIVRLLRQILLYLREYFFPSGCGGCGETLCGGSSGDALYGLCAPCRDFLNTACNDKNRCEICGRHLISEIRVCIPCRTNSGTQSSLVKTRAIFPFSGKSRSVLIAYKFEKSLGIGNFLVRQLCAALESAALESFKDVQAENAAWIPVPPRAGKIKREGWDQIEYLARLLEKERHGKNSLPVRRCLKRLPSRSQKELNFSQRMDNLKRRIICVQPPPETAVLFDDVLTTGATMNACATALLEGGAKQVYGICLFYN